MQKTQELSFHDKMLKKYIKRHSSQQNIQKKSYLMSFREIKGFYKNMNNQILNEKMKKIQKKAQVWAEKRLQPSLLKKYQKITISQVPIFIYKRRSMTNIMNKQYDSVTQPEPTQIVRRRQSIDKGFQYLQKEVQSCVLTNSKSMRYIQNNIQNKKKVNQNKQFEPFPLYKLKKIKNPFLKKIFFSEQIHDENQKTPKKKQVRFNCRKSQF